MEPQHVVTLLLVTLGMVIQFGFLYALLRAPSKLDAIREKLCGDLLRFHKLGLPIDEGVARLARDARWPLSGMLRSLATRLRAGQTLAAACSGRWTSWLLPARDRQRLQLAGTQLVPALAGLVRIYQQRNARRLWLRHALITPFYVVLLTICVLTLASGVAWLNGPAGSSWFEWWLGPGGLALSQVAYDLGITIESRSIMLPGALVILMVGMLLISYECSRMHWFRNVAARIPGAKPLIHQAEWVEIGSLLEAACSNGQPLEQTLAELARASWTQRTQQELVALADLLNRGECAPANALANLELPAGWRALVACAGRGGRLDLQLSAATAHLSELLDVKLRHLELAVVMAIVLGAGVVTGLQVFAVFSNLVRITDATMG
jgi:type II secretory pathway component PulF